MKSIRRPGLLICLCLALLALGACQPADEKSAFQYLPLFGNGSEDTSPVVAQVNGVSITQQDMDLRFREVDDKLRKKYDGPEGKRLMLRDMVDQVLLAQGAVELGLQDSPGIAQAMISNRRAVLEHAMKTLGLAADKEPSEEDLQDYYMAHRSEYQRKGIVKARHIELLNEDEAYAAYDRLMQGGHENRFAMVVKDLSINEVTKADDGNLGWFNSGGFIPDIRDVKNFTTQAFNLQDGINPPIYAGGHWHIVEILQRELERPMTFAEARPTVLTTVLPRFREGLTKDFLMNARREGQVEMLGEYAPGMGLTVEQLLGRAQAVADPNKKRELLEMIYTDFPESDRADDALFLAANLVLDEGGDFRTCGRLLARLMQEYPDSELVPDSQFLMENMNNPKALNPTSIEDLRR